MKLIWLGHSCFKLISKEASLIFDPYAPNSVPGLKPLSETANLVLNSHQPFFGIKFMQLDKNMWGYYYE